MRRLIIAAVMALAIPLTGVSAQQESSSSSSSNPGSLAARKASVPLMEAVRVRGDAITVDGHLDEEAWALTSVAGGFVQLRPDEGEAASERTEVRVLYGDDALYVAFRAFDREPSEIVGQLTRRDQRSYSDRVHVAIDSYNDKRTAFHFAVNPKGVKQDLYRYDDVMEDMGWDAVWDVATRIHEEGWDAEFRIPYSQLRFGNEDVQTWGINFFRDVARRQETSTWAPLSQKENRVVSLSGELTGIRDWPDLVAWSSSPTRSPGSIVRALPPT